VLASLPGPGHALVAADLANPGEAERLWREAIGAAGRIDLLVNNAGTFGDHPPLTTDFAAWERAWQHTLATNLVAPANLAYLAARAMTQAGAPLDELHGRGRIVNISSRGAFRGEPQAPAYGASKAGLNSLSQSLALALAPHAVYVYAIAPGGSTPTWRTAT
jgi:NAD(P)-dependent dehydrogenase (short-subunit alcohol dehydrogenase family)